MESREKVFEKFYNIFLKIKKLELSRLCRNKDENVHRFTLSTDENILREKKRKRENERQR